MAAEQPNHLHVKPYWAALNKSMSRSTPYAQAHNITDHRLSNATAVLGSEAEHVLHHAIFELAHGPGTKSVTLNIADN